MSLVWIALGSFVFLIFIFLPAFMFGMIYFIQQRNMAFAKNHVQVAVLSKNVAETHYQCDKPTKGYVDMYEETYPLVEGKPSKKKVKTLIGSPLWITPHPSYYPPKMWSKLQAQISEIYVCGDTGSFVPVTFEPVDPLEVMMILAQLANEKTTEVVVRASQDKTQEEKRTQKSLDGLKSLPTFMFISILLNLIIGIVLIYMVMKGNSTQQTIITGLKSVGVLP